MRTRSRPSGARHEAHHEPVRRPSPLRRIRYRFDNSLAHGPLALITWLGVATLAVIVVAAAVATLLFGQSSFVQ